jgi:transposase
MGRPTKLNAETQKRFIDGLRLGLTYKLAASYAGIEESTLYLWLQKGRQQDGTIYSEFLDAVKAAEGLCAAQHMGRIMKAAEAGHWQSSAWVMERRFGYSAKQEVKVGAAEDSLEGAEDLIAKVAEVAQALKGAKAGEDER